MFSFRVHNGEDSMAPGSQSRKHSDYILNQKQRTNSSEARLYIPKGHPQWCLPSSKAVPSKHPQWHCQVEASCLSMLAYVEHFSIKLNTCFFMLLNKRGQLSLFPFRRKKVAGGIKITWNGKMLGARSSTNVPEVWGMRGRTKRSQLNNQMCNSIS